MILASAAGSSRLIRAFCRQKSNDVVPVNQIILYPGKQVPVMMLPKGLFVIEAHDKKCNTLSRYENKI